MKRRNFIKTNLVLGSSVLVCYFIPPVRYFVGNTFNSLINEEDFKNVDLKMLSNFLNANELSLVQLIKENQGFDHILALDSQYKNNNTDKNVVKRELNRQEPFNIGRNANAKEVQEVYIRNFNGKSTKSTFEEVLEAGNIFFTAASLPATFYAGIMCATTGVGCLAFLSLGLPSTIFGFGTMLNDEMNKNKLSNATTYKSTLIGHSLFPEYDQKYGFDLSKDFKQNSSFRLSDDVDVNTLKVDDEFKSTIISILKANNESELKPLIQKYIGEAGEKIEANLKEYINAIQQGNQQKALESQNKAFFYQSLNNLISNIIGSVVNDPKLASVLNTVLSAGLQYTLQGLTPYGWTAVGLNLVNSLLFVSKDTFKEELFKALENLQKQLNFIIEQLNAIYNNQITILKQLQTVIDEILISRKITIDKLNEINRQNVRIYGFSTNIEYVRIQSEYEKVILNLNTYVLKRKEYNKALEYINKLVEYLVVDTKNPIFTSYNNTNPIIDGISLKENIFNPHSVETNKPIYCISLHDSIGSISACASYSNGNYGTFSKQINHLPNLYLAICDVFNWIFYSKLDKRDVKPIADQIESTVKQNGDNIKSFASLSIIQQKLNGFVDAYTNFTNQLHEQLNLKHQNEVVQMYEGTFLKSYGLNQQYESNWSNNTIELQVNSTTNLQSTIENNSLDCLIFFKNLGTVVLTNQSVEFRVEYSRWVPFFIGFGLSQALVICKEYHPNLGWRSYETWHGPSPLLATQKVKANFTQLYISGKTISIELDLYKKVFISGMSEERIVAGNGSMDNPNYVGHHVQRIRVDFEFPNWKEIVREKVESKFQKKITEVISNYESFVNFSDLLIYSNKEWAKTVKSRFIFDLTSLIKSQSLIDGFGTSVYTLTKLNELVYSQKLSLFLIDYSTEVFTSDDILDTLNYYCSASFEDDEKNLFDKIKNEQNDTLFLGLSDDLNPYKVKISNGEYKSLNPNFWIDLMIIILKRKMLLSKGYVERTSKELSEMNMDPITVDSLSKVNFLKKAYNIA